jgi:glycosyltransferase involved in cell wall biosynthesis
LRIALFSYAWPQSVGLYNPGIETVVVNLAKGLSHYGSVSVFVSAARLRAASSTLDHAEVVPVEHDFKSGLFQLNQLSFARTVAREFRDELAGCNVLHDVGSLAPLFVRGFADKGIVTFYHSERPSTIRDLLQSIPVPLVLKRELHAAAIAAVSTFAKSQLESELGIDGERIRVIPVGVDLSTFTPTLPKERSTSDFRILFVGSLIRRKDPMTLFLAIPILLARGVPLRLTCIGSGPEERSLRQYAEASGFASRVTFMPYLPTDQLVLSYSQADAVVLPSKLEGFGLVALESMACGTVPVYSGIESHREVVGDAGIPFEVGNAEDLARVLEGFWLNPSLQEELRRSCLEKAKRFDWENVAAAYVRLYRSLVPS